MPLSPEKQARLNELMAKAGQQPQQDQGFSFGEFAGNILPSTGQYLWDTAKSLNPFAVPRNLKAGMAIGQDPGLLLDYYKGRYGGKDQFLETLEQDPAGTLADVSMVGGLLGPTKAVRRASMAADPINLTMNAPAALSKLAPANTPQSLLSSAIKLRTTNKFSQDDIQKAYDTILRENLPADVTGIEKMYDTIGEIGAEKKTLVDAANATVPVDSVLKFIPELRKDVGGFKIGAANDKKLLESYIKQFVEEQKAQGRTRVTMPELEAFKQDLHKLADYSRAPYSTKQERVVEKANKAIARGSKEILEQNIPGIKELNQRQGALLDMREQFEKRVGRIDRRNPLTISEGINTTAGAMVGQATGMGPLPGVMGGLMMTYLNKPQNLSRTAHWLYGNKTTPLAELLGRSRLKTRARQPWQELSVFAEDEQGLLAE